MSALAILLWQREYRPTASSPPSITKSERFRPVRQPQSRPLPPRELRRTKDFQTFVKLAAKDELPELSRQEIDDYLTAQHRSAGSLLAAYHLSADWAYLKEALANFPNSPQVRLCALQMTEDPAQRLEALEAFKHTDPGNGLGNFLAARTLFALGRKDEALAELLQSHGKPIQDYTMISSQDTEEAYLTAGFSPTEAKMASFYYMRRPELIELRGDYIKDFDVAGDAATLESVRGIQLEIGSQLQEDPTILNNLIGILNEKNALKGLDDPESVARIEEITQQHKSIVTNSKKVSAMLENSAVPDDEWRLYFDRCKLFGEKAANEWMLEKYPDH